MGTERVERVTKHLGVRRYRRDDWRVVDLDTRQDIGPQHKTRYEAREYAHERQLSTYGS